MKVKKFKIFLVLSIIAILMSSYVSGIIGSVRAEVIEGSEGDVTWSFNEEDGVLTFSGSGNVSNAWMKDVTSYSSTVKSVEITGTGLTSIGNGSFDKCWSLTSITIPDSVTSIGDGAFSQCWNLTSITIPDSVTSVGDYVFFACRDLTEINVDENNNYYKSCDGVLFNNLQTTLIQYPVGKKEDSYKIPESVTSIGDYAFITCINLTEITIPESVTSIGDYAFSECTGLTNVTIPESVTSIGDNAFEICENLTEITIPDSVTSVGDYVFFCCSDLTEITIPDSVTSIGENAFFDCTSLTNVTIPDSVTSIGHYAFCGCESLKEITIPDSVTSIGDYVFGNCTSLTEIIIPDSVTNIGDSVFDDCESSTIYCRTNSYVETYLKDCNISYISDDTAPTIELTKKGEYIIITSEDTGVGLADKAYSLDRTNWYENNELAVDETNTYTVYVKDKLGNSNQDTIFMDIDLPQIQKVNVNGNKIIITATDNESGLASEPYSIDNTTWQESNEFEITEIGTYTIYVRDVQGNIAEDSIVVTEIKDNTEDEDNQGNQGNQDGQGDQNNQGNQEIETPDTEPPTISIEVYNNIIKVTATDTGVGLADKAYSLDEENWQESNELKVTKTGKYMVYVRDKSGNIARKLAIVNDTYNDKNDSNDNNNNNVNKDDQTPPTENQKPLDGTESPEDLGQYGSKTVILTLIIISLISLITYKKYKKVKFIK